MLAFIPLDPVQPLTPSPPSMLQNTTALIPTCGWLTHELQQCQQINLMPPKAPLLNLLTIHDNTLHFGINIMT